MSIFVLQGQGDLNRVATATKLSFNTLLQQWQTVSDRSKALTNISHFHSCMEHAGSLEGFANPIRKYEDPIDDGDPFGAEKVAFWNPLIGGEYMLYVTYKCSIGLGAGFVDSVGQMRCALHLYNGLRLRDPSLHIPFLHSMDTVFKDIKTVWVGGKPEKGSCCKAFWMSMGVHARRAAELASEFATTKDLVAVLFTNGSDDLRR